MPGPPGQGSFKFSHVKHSMSLQSNQLESSIQSAESVGSIGASASLNHRVCFVGRINAVGRVKRSMNANSDYRRSQTGLDIGQFVN